MERDVSVHLGKKRLTWWAKAPHLVGKAPHLVGKAPHLVGKAPHLVGKNRNLRESTSFSAQSTLLGPKLIIM